MSADHTPGPRVSRWHIVGLVFGAVVVVVTLIGYVRRAILTIESGDAARGTLVLIVLVVGFGALLVASVVVALLLKRQRSRANQLSVNPERYAAGHSPTALRWTERRALIETVLDFTADHERAVDELAHVPWDSDAAVEFTPSMLRAALLATVDGTRSTVLLGQWANYIEMREDVEMTDARVRAIIHALANPELEGPTDSARLQHWIAELGDGVVDEPHTGGEA
ncbi:MAG: hypothetical protein RL499_1236 [Actinomycetota bacterium]